jgi:hypothetical protein
LNNFYVEVHYNGAKNPITWFASFLTATIMELYLDKIDISGFAGGDHGNQMPYLMDKMMTLAKKKLP